MGRSAEQIAEVVYGKKPIQETEEKSPFDQMMKLANEEVRQRAKKVKAAEAKAETARAAVKDAEAEVTQTAQPQRRRNDAEIAKVLYPERDPNEPKVIDFGDGNKKVAKVVRDKQGLIVFERMDVESPEALAVSNVGDLGGLNLSNMKFAGRYLSLRDARADGASFQDSDLSGVDLSNGSFVGADFRGASLAGIQAHFCDFRGCRFDSETDVTGADLFGCKFSDEQIRQCKGFASIRGDRKGRD